MTDNDDLPNSQIEAITSFGDLNPSSRLPCAILLDSSSSMAGAPIQQLNEGVNQFFTEVLADDFARYAVEPMVISFGGTVNTILDFSSLAEVDSCDIENLQASGGTPMGQAILEALSALEGRKEFYRKSGIPYYRPWLIILTDGEPTDDVSQAAQFIHSYEANGKLVTLGVFIGQGRGYQTLAGICPPGRPPKALQGLRFKEFFVWLSASMKAVSRSSTGDKVKLPPSTGWDSI